MTRRADRREGQCRECLFFYALRINGTLYSHGARDANDQPCPGSGRTPKPDGDPVLLKVLLDPDMANGVRAACARQRLTPPDLTRRAIAEYLRREADRTTERTNGDRHR